MALSILQCLNMGKSINVNEGSFGTPGDSGVSVVFDKLVDCVTLTTAAVKYTMFDGTRASNFSNMPAGLVPGGDRWDLYGLSWFWGNASGLAAEAVQAAFRAFVMASQVVVQLGVITVIDQPLFPYFGNQGLTNTFVSTVTAASGPSTTQSFNEPWPESLFLTLQQNVKMNFAVVCTAAAGATLNGMYLGAWFPRVRASRSA